MSGAIPSAYSRLLRDLSAIVRSCFPALTFLGCYRYRVIDQNSDDGRLVLQAVDKTIGLPDLPCVSIRAGVAGYAATLTPGSIVRVQFDDGSPTLPRVVGFGIDDSEGITPVKQSLDAISNIEIGSSADLVQLGSGSELSPPASENGRVIRYGDMIAMPVGAAAVMTAIPATPFGAVPIPAQIAKVSA
jgi:hypothetical protein